MFRYPVKVPAANNKAASLHTSNYSSTNASSSSFTKLNTAFAREGGTTVHSCSNVLLVQYNNNTPRYFSAFCREDRRYPLYERKGSKGGKGGGKGNKKGDDDDEEDSTPPFEFDIDDYKTKFQPAVDNLKRTFETLKVNRATPSLLDNIGVETAEGNLPVNQIGQVIIKDPQTLQVTLYDEKNLKAAEKSIRESPLGLTPTIDSGTIKVKIPKPTKELRESMVKVVNQHGEEAKNDVRNIRKKILDQIKKNKISKDDERNAEKQIQTLVDDSNKTITNMCNAKVKEFNSM